MDFERVLTSWFHDRRDSDYLTMGDKKIKVYYRDINLGAKGTGKIKRAFEAIAGPSACYKHLLILRFLDGRGFASHVKFFNCYPLVVMEREKAYDRAVSIAKLWNERTKGYIAFPSVKFHRRDQFYPLVSVIRREEIEIFKITMMEYRRILERKAPEFGDERISSFSKQI